MSVECGQGESLMPGDSHILPTHPLIRMAASIEAKLTVVSCVWETLNNTVYSPEELNR